MTCLTGSMTKTTNSNQPKPKGTRSGRSLCWPGPRRDRTTLKHPADRCKETMVSTVAFTGHICDSFFVCLFLCLLIHVSDACILTGGAARGKV
jgi:hypothetical protein